MDARLRLWIGRRLLVVAVCVLLGWRTLAAAQTVYKWTDDDGVVHFSDAPPMLEKGVETQTMHAPANRQAAAAKNEEPLPGTGARSAVAKPKPKVEGPARVVVASRESPRTGPSALHITGAVKNVGGSDAARVSVTISAVDRAQGTPCLREQADVQPSTLHAGETGNFEMDVDSPCLYVDQMLGDPSIDVEAHWD